MHCLRTDRLDVLALSREQLQLCLDSPNLLEEELGFPILEDIVSGPVPRAIRMKLAKMTHVGEERSAWFTYWLLIVRGARCGIGLAGFKGIPDENGEAEIGYGIHPSRQGQGYMTEAASALISWAFQEPACLAVIACDVKKSNLASQRVLAKVGMEVYAETEDAFCMRVRRGSAGLAA